MTLPATTTDEPQVVESFKEASGVAPYTFKKDSGETTSGQVEWISCVGKAPRGAVVVMHDRTGFEAATFCGDWLGQTFLSQGYATIGVNRPGFGRSSGVRDLVGQASVAAVLAGVKAAQSEGRLPKLTAAYGYGVGAIAATLAAKRLNTVDFLLLGGGIYDLEDILQNSADGELKAEITKVQALEGDHAIEIRSVGYDVSGLPKKIAVYHGKLDTTVPPTQAKAFSDSLESSGEYRVTMQVIDGLTHDIPPQHHRKILEVLLVSSGGQG